MYCEPRVGWLVRRKKKKKKKKKRKRYGEGEGDLCSICPFERYGL